jgi:hypothetical protein
MTSSRWTPELLESKVMELLSESDVTGIPPLVESRATNSSGIYTPAPVEQAPKNRSRTPNPVPRLTRDQEKNLINRLYRSSSKPPVAVAPATVQVPLRSTLSARSQALTRDLEPIDVRSTKLIQARQKRLEKLTAEKAEEEKRAATGYPTINERSRIIAERLTPERRQEIVDQRRKLLMEESIQRERENCVFHPTINRGVRRSSFSVTDRLVRDVEGRKQRHARLEAEREREILSQVRPVPEISDMARSMILRESQVHDRLSRSSNTPEPVRVVSFNDWYGRHDPPPNERKLQTPNTSYLVTRPHSPPTQTPKASYHIPQVKAAEATLPLSPRAQTPNRSYLVPRVKPGETTRRLDLSMIFSNKTTN